MLLSIIVIIVTRAVSAAAELVAMTMSSDRLRGTNGAMAKRQ